MPLEEFKIEQTHGSKQKICWSLWLRKSNLPSEKEKNIRSKKAVFQKKKNLRKLLL